MKPFEDIPVDITERIEFSNLTITSSSKELGRSKIVTNKQDIEEIAKYLKTISCIESNNKDRDPDFMISLFDNTKMDNGYIYLMGASKNQIFLYKYNSKESTRFVYKNIDTKVMKDLSNLYAEMNYKEELLMRK